MLQWNANTDSVVFTQKYVTHNHCLSNSNSISLDNNNIDNDDDKKEEEVIDNISS